MPSQPREMNEVPSGELLRLKVTVWASPQPASGHEVFMVKKPKENYIVTREKVTKFRFQCPEV